MVGEGWCVQGSQGAWESTEGKQLRATVITGSGSGRTLQAIL